MSRRCPMRLGSPLKNQTWLTGVSRAMCVCACFRPPRRERRVALDDRFVDLCAARDVVRLRGEQFLEDVRRAVGFERPDLHFAEPLPAELRLAAERLLRDERVRPDL